MKWVDVGLVVIILFNIIYFLYVKEVILKGKYVVVEKLFVVLIEEGEEFILLVE